MAKRGVRRPQKVAATRKKSAAARPASTRTAASSKPATRRTAKAAVRAVPAAKNATARRSPAKPAKSAKAVRATAPKKGAGTVRKTTAVASRPSAARTPSRPSKPVGRATGGKSKAAPSKKVAVKKVAVKKSAAPGKAAPNTKLAASTSVRTATSPARPRNASTPAKRPTDGLDPIVQSPPSSLDMNRRGTAARTGRAEIAESRADHATMTPSITGGDVDASVEDAYFTGDEAPGGDNTTPDQDIVDDIGRALGVEYQDNEELRGSDKVADRDKHRWELDPASAEDYKERK